MNTSVTSEADSPTTTEPGTRPKLQLSATQLVASALAAITATVAASYLGIAGTVVGAALAAVLTVTGNAVYGHSLQRTGERVREVVPVVERLTTRTGTVTTAKPATRVPRRRGRWPVFAAATIGVFVGVLVVVTGFEVVAGRPLSDVVRGKSGSGTTLVDTGRTTTVTPTQQVTITITPAVVTQTPTVTVTGSAATTTTQAPTPSATSTPSSTPTPTPTSSASVSGTSTAG